MPTRIASENELAGATTPTIYNVTLTSANTEYPQALPTNCRKFSVRPRTSSHVLKMAYTSGQSATTYLTIDTTVLFNDLIGCPALVLYFQSTTAGAIVEIEAWA